MNKIATTLAGLAFVAAASVAPVLAQSATSTAGNFFTNGPFVFSFSPASSFTVTSLPVGFNQVGSTTVANGFLTLTGGTEVGTSEQYTGTTLSFSPTLGGAPTITDLIPSTVVVPLGTGGFTIASVGSSASGNTFNLANGSPVPEASTVLSFGALLALGGLAVVRKKTSVKNAA